MMAPPYLMIEDTLFITSTWDTGHVSMAYQTEAKEWFIEATSRAKFYVDFLFTIPDNASGLVIHFGKGMTVAIE